MRKIMDIVLIIGFLAADFFFFHDIFKPGEITTLPQYVTGILSVPVLIISARSLFGNRTPARGTVLADDAG